MKMPDVNVVIGAYRADATHHDRLRDWLAAAVDDPEPVGVTDAVAIGFVRIVTNRRAFVEPTEPELAIDAMSELMAAAGATRVTPGAGYWDRFRATCVEGAARGPLVSDAAHAALAIEAGATWYTLDRDFARFPRLRWRSPLA